MDSTFILPFAEGVAATLLSVAVIARASRKRAGNEDSGTRRGRLRIAAIDDIRVSLSTRSFRENRVAIENASFDGVALHWDQDRHAIPKGASAKIDFIGTVLETTVISHDNGILRLRYTDSVTPEDAQRVRSACLHGRTRPLKAVA